MILFKLKTPKNSELKRHEVADYSVSLLGLINIQIFYGAE